MFTDKWASIESAAAWEVAQSAAELELERLADATWARIGKLLEQAVVGQLRPNPSAVAAPRVPASKADQLSLFGAPSSPQTNVEATIDPFHGPCVVCGEPGRRRNTMPAAIAAVMPPLEPTCEGHELVVDWGIQLSADQAERMFLGELPGTPTFSYRTVRGSKAAAALRPPKPKAIKAPKKPKASACP